MFKTLVFNNMVVDKDGKWVYDINFNAIFYISNSLNTLRRKSDYLGEGTIQGTLYSKIFEYKGKIIGVPQLAEKILILEKDSGCSRYVDLPNELVQDEVYCGYFWHGIVDEKYLYMIGYGIPYILKFDMESEQILSYVMLMQEVKRGEKVVYFKDALMDENIWIPCCETNAVVNVDKESLHFKENIISGTVEGFSTLQSDGEFLWLIPRKNGPIVKWKKMNGESVVFSQFPYKRQAGEKRLSFGFSVDVGDEIIIFPLKIDYVISINKESGAMKNIGPFCDFLQKNVKGKEERQRFNMIQRNGNSIFCSSSLYNALLEFDIQKRKLINISLEVPEEEYINYMFFVAKARQWTMYEREVTLESYLKYLTFSADICGYESKDFVNIGTKIHDEMKKN